MLQLVSEAIQLDDGEEGSEVYILGCCPLVPDKSVDLVIYSAAINCYHGFEEVVHPYCGIAHRPVDVFHLRSSPLC